MNTVNASGSFSSNTHTSSAPLMLTLSGQSRALTPRCLVRSPQTHVAQSGKSAEGCETTAPSGFTTGSAVGSTETHQPCTRQVAAASGSHACGTHTTGASLLFSCLPSGCEGSGQSSATTPSTQSSQASYCDNGVTTIAESGMRAGPVKPPAME